MKRLTTAVLVAGLTLLLAGCIERQGENRREEDKEVVPSATGQLRLAEAAQTAIGLATEPASRREVRGAIVTTGWLAARPSSEAEVKAPVTGFVVPRDAASALPGHAVTQDDLLANLHVFLSPQEQAQLVATKEDADIVIQQAQASLKLAEEHLRRLEDTSSGVVSGSRLMELRELVARSRAAEEEAREKLPFLPAEPYAKNMQLKAVPLEAPLSGRLIGVHFAPRQLVVQGDPLWTIADWSRLWLRVPVYAADVPRIVQTDSVHVIVPGSKVALAATPAGIPQSTEPGKQTVELIYELDNAAGKLRPGQAVTVSLPTGARSEEIVIPPTAILWDGMGNSWVYVRTSSTTFRRCKVEVSRELKAEGQGPEAVVVTRGLEAGVEVVAVGAEALYGEEFKWQIQGEDED